MTYRAVIFDLDGTLLNTLDDLHTAVNAALARHGYPLRTREEVRTFVGNGVALLIQRALPPDVDEVTAAAVLADFKAHYAAHSADRTAPYGGISALLDGLREKGIRVAVVSNKFDAAVKALCARYFDDRVEVAIGESDGVRKKPAPDTVFEALRLLGISPREAVYVGDSDVDIETAKSAGMKGISVTWGFRDEEFLIRHGAVNLVRTPEELLGWLLRKE